MIRDWYSDVTVATQYQNTRLCERSEATHAKTVRFPAGLPRRKLLAKAKLCFFALSSGLTMNCQSIQRNGNRNIAQWRIHSARCATVDCVFGFFTNC